MGNEKDGDWSKSAEGTSRRRPKPKTVCAGRKYKSHRLTVAEINFKCGAFCES